MKRYQEFVNEQVDRKKKLIDSARNGNLEGVKKSLDNGVDVHANEDEAFRLAVMKGHLEVVKYLFDNGADIHAGDDWALRHASGNGHLEVVKYLVEKGADIHAQNDLALRWASEIGHLEVVKYLCEWIIQNEAWYIPYITQYIPEEIKEKYVHLFAASDMDLL